MTLHWTEKAHAIASIGAELKKRGWTIFGYDPGESDGMTDYYRPAHWDGVAIHPQHPGVVVGVHVSTGTVQYNSGKKDWPTFHATPNRRAWHIEQHGKVIATGVGLEACARSSTEGYRAVTQLVDEIEAAAASCRNNGHTPALPTASNAIGIRIQHERDWTWVFFPGTPAEAIREALRSHFGAAFSKKRIGWYITRPVETEAVLQVIQSASGAPAEEPAQAAYPGSPAGEDKTGPCGFVPGQGSAYDYTPAWMSIPKLYASENAKETPLAVIKLFNPDGAWTYYILEWDGQDTIFGLATGMGYETELGYASLGEIRETRSAQLHLQMERDLWFKPTPVTELNEYQEKWGNHGPYHLLQPAAQKAAPDANSDGPDFEAGDWERQDIEFLLELLADGQPILVDRPGLGVWPVQHFAGVGQVVDGQQIVEADGYTIRFDVGEAMAYTPSGRGRWTAVETLQGKFPCDTASARAHLQALLEQPTLPAVPALPVAPEPAPVEGGLPPGWLVEDIEHLLKKLEEGPIVVSDSKLGIPTIHEDFGAPVEHAGFGLMVCKGPGFEVSFDAGGAMQRTPSNHGWSRLNIKGSCPYQYDVETVRRKLQSYLPAQAAQPQPAAARPQAVKPSEPWELSQVGYMMSKASFAGGVPIMNGADGDEHKRLVLEALRAGKPVPAYVLEDYPNLGQEQAEAAQPPEPPAFQKQLTGEAALALLQEAAAVVPEMSGVGDAPAFDQRLANDAPCEQKQAEGKLAAAVEPAPLGPQAEAELKAYELEILTGRVDKRSSAFYNTIARVQPGTLRLALQRIPTGDTRRRQEIERRLGGRV